MSHMTKIDLIEEYSQNTLWNNLFRLNFRDVPYWEQEFSRFLNFLQNEVATINNKPVTWKNTYVRMKKVVCATKYISDFLGYYFKINNQKNDNISTLTYEVQQKFDAFMGEIRNDSALIAKFNSLATLDLSEEKKSIHNAWVNNFFQMYQDKEIKKNYSQISNKLDKHIQKFQEINEQVWTGEANTIYVPKRQAHLLEGLSKTTLKEANKNALKARKQGWLFYMSDSMASGIIRSAKNRYFRKRVYNRHHKINSVGDFTFKNAQVLKNILQEKHKIAQLMGKDNYAELVLSKYLMNTPQQAFEYLNNIEDTLYPAVKNIQTIMYGMARADGITKLKAWDVPYYFQKVSDKYNPKNRQFENYYNFNEVLPKVLSFFEKKFNLRITKEEFNPVSNKDLICLKVEDKSSKRNGIFLVSPFENLTKACCSQIDILKSDTVEKGFVLPNIQFIDLMIAKKKNGSAKMCFYDMTTLMHEFGHAFHSFFDNIEDHLDKNLKMSWDLIEMPSQFLEHLVYDYDFMKSMSSHAITQKSMDKECYMNIIKQQQFFQSYHIYCNIQTYKVQLSLHQNFKPYSAKNLQEIVEKQMSKKGIIYNIAQDHYMTYSDYNLDYGPASYIYLYSAQLAFQLYQKKPKDLKKVFTNTFNSSRKKILRDHMEQNFKLNKLDIGGFIRKGLPISVCI